MFQFDLCNLCDLSIKPSAVQARSELGGGFDGWARAAWFAKPNCWLANRGLAYVLALDLAGVLAAARVDRSISVD